MNVKARIEIEKKIARQIVRDAIAAGYFVRVYDGEEFTTPRTQDESAIMSALMTTDDDRLYFYESSDASARAIGWAYLVYGNDGYDVVNDYTTNLESLMSGADRLADKLEKQYA